MIVKSIDLVIFVSVTYAESMYALTVVDTLCNDNLALVKLLSDTAVTLPFSSGTALKLCNSFIDLSIAAFISLRYPVTSFFNISSSCE